MSRGEEPAADDLSLDELNDQAYRLNRAGTLDEVRREERAAYSQLIALTANATDDELFNPQHFAWTQGKPFAEWIVNNTYGHYEEHAADLGVLRPASSRYQGGQWNEKHATFKTTHTDRGCPRRRGLCLWFGVLLTLWSILHAAGVATDFWPMAQTLTSTVTMVCIVAGSVVAFHQLNEAASNRHLAVADRLFEELNLAENIAARRWIFHNLPEDPEEGSRTLTPEGQAAIKSVLNSLDHIAFLTQAGWIPEEMIIPGPQDGVVEIGGFNDRRRIPVGVEDAAVVLAWHLAVDAHRADEDQPLHARGMHRVHDDLCLLRHRAGQIGIHHVLSLHRNPKVPCVEHVTFDDLDAARVRILQPLCPTQIQP